MESLPYYLIFFAGFVVISLLLFSTLIFLLGIFLLVRQARNQRPAASKSTTAALLITLVGGFLLVNLCFYITRIIYSMNRNLWRANQPNLCLTLTLTEDYSLSVFQQADRAWGYLEDSDGNQILVPHIKGYAIVDNVMVGKDPYFWFWADLDTGESKQGLTDAEYHNALKSFGFINVPNLLLIEDICQIHTCLPCPTVTPSFDGY